MSVDTAHDDERRARARALAAERQRARRSRQKAGEFVPRHPVSIVDLQDLLASEGMLAGIDAEDLDELSAALAEFVRAYSNR